MPRKKYPQHDRFQRVGPAQLPLPASSALVARGGGAALRPAGEDAGRGDTEQGLDRLLPLPQVREGGAAAGRLIFLFAAGIFE